MNGENSVELTGKVALITGAAGFVGSRIAQRFLQESMRVRGLVQRTAEAASIEVVGLEPVVGDITDRVAVQQAAIGATLSTLHVFL
jgi:nucleoside-diphosphate-sugar epimerase